MSQSKEQLSAEAEFDRIDPERYEYYQEQLALSLDEIQPGQKVLIVCHSDTDGIIGGTTAAYYLQENKPGVNMDFCHAYLDSEAFYEAAKDADHVIVSDLWIDDREGKQDYLRRLQAEGKNITILDHHDERYEKNIPTIEELKANAFTEHDRLIPETIPAGLKPAEPGGKIGRFLYITPNRLGSEIGGNYTASMVTYKMLAPHSKTKLQKIKPLLSLSTYGDYAFENWPNLLKETGSTNLTEELGYALNAGHSLRDPANLIKQILQIADYTGSIYQQIAETPEGQVLLKILRTIRRQIADVTWDPSTQPLILPTEIPDTAADDPSLKSPLLKEFPVVISATADELRKKFNKVIVALIQYSERKHKLSFRADDKTGLDTRPIARLFGGDGHKPASGAVVPLQEGQTREQAMRLISATLARENAKYLDATADQN